MSVVLVTKFTQLNYTLVKPTEYNSKKKLLFAVKLNETFWKNLIKTCYLKNALDIVTGKTASHPLNLAVKMILPQINLLMAGKMKTVPS